MTTSLELQAQLETLKILADAANFDKFLAQCNLLADNSDATTFLAVGSLLLNYGFVSAAKNCFQQALALNPNDLNCIANLANAAREVAAHTEATSLYRQLLKVLPDNAVIRRNYLSSLEYDPNESDESRSQQAKEWGQWAIQRAGGARLRPAFKVTSESSTALRVGFVSADICQHTVGLLVKDVLQVLNRQLIDPIVYSARTIKDWVYEQVSSSCPVVDVSGLNDIALAKRIQTDGIDILVDLSGHTAGSMLTAFAYRPAPVQVSWLGYFASTGLPCMDAVLLDEGHVTEATQSLFTEDIISLPQGRWCYQPVPWAPNEVAPSPHVHKRHITFGSFNNTAKLNDELLDVWTDVLKAVPNSRLILKWRTFNDEDFKAKITASFEERDIEASRIELRGPSFHNALLNEYADIDIALDPFPFTGGLTSCEALWMGVPVVTWPQSRVVSRQTFSILQQIGLPELAAADAQGYLRIATQLANDSARLVQLRQTLRHRMRQSVLMDVQLFTKNLETTLIDLFSRIKAQENKSILIPEFDGAQMPTIKIDHKEYDLGKLSDEAKAKLKMMMAADAEIKRLQECLAMTQTARNAYARALGELLPK